MCGRYVAASTPDDLAAYFGAAMPETLLPPSYNVAPTSDVYAVVERPEGRVLEVVHWGFVPSWAKERKVGQRMINARAEGLADSRAFRSSFRARRCIVPADGFYEWQSSPADRGAKPKKQPYYLHRADGEPLALAGLWSAWRDPQAPADAPWLVSATIITTAANERVAPLHDRMPAILPASCWSTWLDPANQDVEALARLLGPAPEELLVLDPVSTDVNSVRNQGPQLIEPITQPAPDDPPSRPGGQPGGG